MLMPAIKWLFQRITYAVVLSLLGLSALSFADAFYPETPAQVRQYLLENHLYSESPDCERTYIEQCFQPENPFQYCLVLLNWRWQFLDEKLESPYDVFMFDNGPDDISEGFYRIRQNDKIGYADAITGKVVIPTIYECAYPFQNGQAKVGLKCQTLRDGEHFYWETEEWLLLDKPE